MSLTSKQVENAKPQAKPYKLTDGGNLSLHVAPTGKRTWRFRCQVDGRDALKVLGEFPPMTLALARKARDAERGVRAVAALEPARPQSELFANVAQQYIQRKMGILSPHVRSIQVRRLERLVYPALGSVPIGDITSKMLWDVIKGIEAKHKTGCADRTLGLVRKIFAGAKIQGLIDQNPATDMRGELQPMPTVKHRAKVVTIEDARAAVRALEAESSHPLIKLCFRLMALTALRPGECCGALWDEFSGIDGAGENATWTVPAERMKMERPHLLFLSRQAVEVLQVARMQGGGNHRCVFPSIRREAGSLTTDTMRDLHHRAGMRGRLVPHGWRGTFSTIMNELHVTDEPVIELMLAHVNKNMVARAYNGASHKERRRELAQEWADMLLDGAPSAMELVDWSRQHDRGPNVLRFEFPPLREVA